MGKFYNLAESDGYEMEIKTHAATTAIGGGAPSFFCRAFAVTKLDFCYEVISLSNN